LTAAAQAVADARPSSLSPTTNPLLSSVAEPCPAFDWHDLVEPEHWDQVPADVPELLALLPRADLYVQDEVDIRLHPTLTRCWSRKGKTGQRLVRAPGQSARIVGFGAIDWRDGWVSYGFVLGRTAEAYCGQLTHLVTRSQQRGRIAVVLADNLGIQTPARSKKLREMLATHGDHLRLVYTPAYDPEANPIERFWKPFRHQVTHNHQRENLYDLHIDAYNHFLARDSDPKTALREIGSPFADDDQTAA
jgi:hypothetical protein